jgi:hypothetical protein
MNYQSFFLTVKKRIDFNEDIIAIKTYDKSLNIQ